MSFISFNNNLTENQNLNTLSDKSVIFNTTEPFDSINTTKEPLAKTIENNDKSKDNSTLSNLLDNLGRNSLDFYYENSQSIFKKKIDELNLKFYLETEKYLANKQKDNKTQDLLFIILFKQINLYIEEIERLNSIISDKKLDPKWIKERTDDYIKKQKEFETKELLIKTLKDSKAHVESKLQEVIGKEDKLKMENERLKKENEILKGKLINFLSKPKTKQSSNITNETTAQTHQLTTSEKIILSKKRNYSDNHPSINSSSTIMMPKLKMKREIGIIKAVKDKLKRNCSNENKIKSSGNLVSANKTLNSPMFVNTRKSKEKNMDYVDKFMNEVKLDFMGDMNPSENNFGHVKTEVIVSDLEEYYNNNSSKITNMIENSIHQNSLTHSAPFKTFTSSHHGNVIKTPKKINSRKASGIFKKKKELKI